MPYVSPVKRRGRGNFSRSILNCGVVAVLLTPLLLFAYLGQFRRLMSDDYCAIAVGQELGPWGSMIHWYNLRSSSYSNFFLQGMLSPLDTLVPIVSSGLIIAVFWVGLCWLMAQGLQLLSVERNRKVLAISVSSLTIAVVVNALGSPQAFYWHSASTEYFLSTAVLTLSFAFAVWSTRRWANFRHVVRGGILAAALCFVSAGMAEMFLLAQLSFLTLILLISLVILDSPWRRRMLIATCGAWLATVASLVIQLSSPGIAFRAAAIVQHYGLPDRSLAYLVEQTFSHTSRFIASPQALSGFVFCICTGLLVMLHVYAPEPAEKQHRKLHVAAAGVSLLLIVQLFCIPLLWPHLSNDRQILGRFSLNYAAVLALNAGLIVTLLVALRWRYRVNSLLERRETGLLLVWLAIAFVVSLIALAILANFQGIDSRAKSYLIATFFGFVVLLLWYVLAAAPTALLGRLGLLSILLYSSAAICIAVLAFVALYGRGFVAARITVPGTYLMLLAGLIWGTYLGCLIKSAQTCERPIIEWIRVLKILCLAAVLTIGGELVISNASLIPDFQLYAREWDARHQKILDLRDAGQRDIVVEPLTFNLADHLYVSVLGDVDIQECVHAYYGVDSISVVDIDS